jgi:hypothetical protein
MKRMMVSTMIFLIIAVLAPQFSYASVTPGTSCKSLAQQRTFNGKIYTCIQSGKKLIWNKGISIPVLNRIPKAVYPTITEDMHEIGAEGYSWTVGRQEVGFSCWSGSTLKDAVVLQVKKSGKWLNKQVGYLMNNSSKCGADYPHGVFFNWVVDETGDTPTDNRSLGLMARVAFLNPDGSVRASGSPFVREVYNSESDRMADFSDALNELFGTSSSGKGLPTSKFANCSFKGKKLYGAIYITKYSFDADIKAYVTNYSFDADLDVYRTPYSFDANSCGKWYLTPYSFDANLKVYLTSYSFDADIKIYYTNYSFEAGLNR